MADNVIIDRPVTPELVPLWHELKARYLEKINDTNDRQARVEDKMTMMENLLATLLGCLSLQEFTEAKINLRWAIQWRDAAIAEIRLAEWKLRMLSAMDHFMQVYKSY